MEACSDAELPNERKIASRDIIEDKNILVNNGHICAISPIAHIGSSDNYPALPSPNLIVLTRRKDTDRCEGSSGIGVEAVEVA